MGTSLHPPDNAANRTGEQSTTLSLQQQPNLRTRSLPEVPAQG